MNTASEFRTVPQNCLRGCFSPDTIILKIDCSNAFNTIHRTAILEGIRRWALELLSAFYVTYGRPSTVWYYHDSGKRQSLENSRGVTQGDPLGCLFFILGLLTILSPLRESAADVEIPSYLDDLHLLGRLDDVLATFTTLVERLESIGLTVNQAKTQL